MSRCVVDASVAVKWFIPELHSDAALRLLDGSRELLAPDLIFAECGNAVWQRVRRGELTAGEAREFVRALLAIRLGILPSAPLLEPALEIAIGPGPTVYDALYVALALEADCPLVTADRALLRSLAGTGLESHLRWVEDPL